MVMSISVMPCYVRLNYCFVRLKKTLKKSRFRKIAGLQPPRLLGLIFRKKDFFRPSLNAGVSRETQINDSSVIMLATLLFFAANKKDLLNVIRFFVTLPLWPLVAVTPLVLHMDMNFFSLLERYEG